MLGIGYLFYGSYVLGRHLVTSAATTMIGTYGAVQITKNHPDVSIYKIYSLFISTTATLLSFLAGQSLADYLLPLDQGWVIVRAPLQIIIQLISGLALSLYAISYLKH